VFNNKKLYKSPEWVKFTDEIKKRDNYKCLKCGKDSNNATLQVHHEKYILGKKPWEYDYSYCLTVCKGCHSQIHNITEPNSGWELISIEDLGSLDGVCEKKGCSNPIRYLHEIYHPNWGYKTVGSTCVEYLTDEDKYFSKETVKIFRKITQIMEAVTWYKGYTKKEVEYSFCKYKYNEIRIYKSSFNNDFSIQIGLNKKGLKSKNWLEYLKIKNKKYNQVKELAIIVLLGNISKIELEKIILRGIYKRLNNF
jgi:hypothetical protein